MCRKESENFIKKPREEEAKREITIFYKMRLVRHLSWSELGRCVKGLAEDFVSFRLFQMSNAPVFITKERTEEGQGRISISSGFVY